MRAAGLCLTLQLLRSLEPHRGGTRVAHPSQKAALGGAVAAGGPEPASEAEGAKSAPGGLSALPPPPPSALT